MNRLNFDDSLNKKALFIAFLFPLLLVLIHFFSTSFSISIIKYGVYPKSISGLKGIFLSFLIHSSWTHLLSNSLALIPLLYFLFYYYKSIFWKVLFLTILMSGFWTWLIGRPSFHVGASGVVNGLAVFLFFSGLIRRHKKLMGVSLLVVLLYGSILWGMFPAEVLSWFLNQDVSYNQNISWEAHLSGFIVGIILSFYFKDVGLVKNKYLFDDSDLDDDNPYWLESFKENDDV